MELVNALRLIAQRHPRGLSKTRLLKMLWLSELRHLERHGQRLTDAGWFRWDYGPLSKDVLNTVRDDDENFDLTEQETPNGHTRHAVRVHDEDKPIEGNEDEFKTIDDVLWEFRDYSDEEILEEVYADPFFDATAYGFDFAFDELSDFRNVSFTDEEIEKILRA